MQPIVVKAVPVDTSVVGRVAPAGPRSEPEPAETPPARRPAQD